MVRRRSHVPLALLSDRCTVHTSKRLINYTAAQHGGKPGVVLVFADGSIAVAKLSLMFLSVRMVSILRLALRCIIFSPKMILEWVMRNL